MRGFRDDSLQGREIGIGGIERWNSIEELRHQNNSVQFSCVEIVAVGKRLYVCCGYSETGLISTVSIRD
jgi:hypothetical protein